MGTITGKGFELKEPDEIVEDIKDIFTQSFIGIDVSNNTPLGNVSLLVGAKLDDFQVDSQEVYNSFDLDGASGNDLDALGKIIGLERYAFTPANALCDFESSSAGYTIFKGSIFYLNGNSENPFIIENDTMITSVSQHINIVATEYKEIEIEVGDKFTSNSVLPDLLDIEILSFISGIEAETDLSYRNRLKKVRLGNGCGKERLKTEILGLSGVIDAEIFDKNDNSAIALGNISAVVLGGNDNEIAGKILESLDMGIVTTGDVEETVTDYKGNNILIKFSRPEELTATFTLVVIVKSGQSFGQEQRQSIVDAFNQLANDTVIGGTLFYQDFYSNIVELVGASVTIKTLTINTGTADIIATDVQKIVPNPAIDPNTNITID